MFYDNSDPDFPNWWEVIEQNKSASDSHDSPSDADADSVESPAIRYVEDQEELAPRFSKQDEEHVEDEEGPAYQVRGEYDREIVCRVWEFAEPVPGNDSDLWRKDEYGNWIYRLDYGKRDSEFGWEIFDPAAGRQERGVYAMRPVQWENYVKQFEAQG